MSRARNGKEDAVPARGVGAPDLGLVDIARLLRASRAAGPPSSEQQAGVGRNHQCSRQDERQQQADESLASAAAAISCSTTSLSVIVAGSKRLHHRLWVGPDSVLTLAAVEPGRWRAMLDPADRLAIVLFRLAGLGPRRGAGPDRTPMPWHGARDLAALDDQERAAALAELRADVCWMLASQSAGGGSRTWCVLDGPQGPYWWKDGSSAWEPTTSGALYLTFAELCPDGT